MTTTRPRNRLRPIHPGEVLRDELDELGMSATAVAEALHVPPNRITAILAGRRGISADTALRLSRYLGTGPELWLDLQKSYELRSAERASGPAIANEVRPRVGAD